MVTDKALTGTALMNAYQEEWDHYDDPYLAYMVAQATRLVGPASGSPAAAKAAEADAAAVRAARQVEGVERQVLSPYGQWLEERECL